MGIGLGIVLIVIGAILTFAVDIKLSYVSVETIGIIFMVAGVLAIILALIINAQRGRTRHIQENRFDSR